MTQIAESLQPLVVPIESVKPDPKNARLHPTPNMDAIKKRGGKRIGAGRKPTHTKEEIAAALTAKHGYLFLAARSLNIKAHAVGDAVRKYPDLKELVEDCEGELLDIAEVKLMAAIQQGQAWAICFFLKTKGKSRGYVERTEAAVDLTTKGKELNGQRVIPNSVIDEAMEILYKAGCDSPAAGDNGTPSP